MTRAERNGGYGSRSLVRAETCARTLRFSAGDLTVRGFVGFLTQLARLPVLIWYVLRLPKADVPLSDGPAGRMITEHLTCRRWGVPRFRLAQGVLYLPSDISTYMSGRRKRHALRANLNRAKERGFHCEYITVPDWTPCETPGDPGNRGLTTKAPTERWRVTGRDGACIAEAWLTVDEKCALLHFLKSTESYARWLLHTAIVERLCTSSCQMLLTNSYDSPLLAPGQQHFQHLLGYSVARLRPRPPRLVVPTRWRLQLAGFGVIAVLAIVSSQMFTSPDTPAGLRALVWLSALVAIRLATRRTGTATVVSGLAGLVIGVLGIAPTLTIPLAYFVCGVAIDILLALLPRLAHTTAAISLLGVIVMSLTSIAPAFPTLGHHPQGASWMIPPILGAVVFGALAGALGRKLGYTIRQIMPAPLRVGDEQNGDVRGLAVTDDFADKSARSAYGRRF